MKLRYVSTFLLWCFVHNFYHVIFCFKLTRNNIKITTRILEFGCVLSWVDTYISPFLFQTHDGGALPNVVMFTCTISHCGYSNYTAESVRVRVGLADWEINIYDDTHTGPEYLNNVSFNADSTIMTWSAGNLCRDWFLISLISLQGLLYNQSINLLLCCQIEL